MEYQLNRQTLCAALGIVGMFSTTAFAQDSRAVSEPRTPPVCTTLSATDSAATEQIQRALNACTPGHAVQLSAAGKNTVFNSGPLSLPSGVSLILDQGVTLRAVNRARDFENAPSSCGVVDSNGKGCKAFITANKTTNSGIYGPGVIDGQGGVTLDDNGVSWWALAADAKVKKLKQNAPRLLQINHSKDFTLYNVSLINAPNFHVVFSDGDGFTAWKTTINTPATARNTDGIDPMSSKNITIAYSKIATGDDNVAIKAYKGRSETRNVSIIHNEFGVGHGMSIGSETQGIYNVTVDDLVMKGTTNGLRIKSDRSAAGTVAGIRYHHVTMTNVAKPIVIDTQYENKKGNLVPDWRDITFTDITSDTKGTVVLNGVNAAAPIAITLQNVRLSADTVWQQNNVQVNP